MYEHMLTPSYYQANADASEIQLYACISRQEENRRRADKAEEIIAWTKASASREAEVLQTRHREETKQAEFQTRCHAQQAASSTAQAEKARRLLGEFASELHDLTVHNLPLSPALVSLAPALAAAAAAAGESIGNCTWTDSVAFTRECTVSCETCTKRRRLSCVLKFLYFVQTLQNSHDEHTKGTRLRAKWRLRYELRKRKAIISRTLHSYQSSMLITNATAACRWSRTAQTPAPRIRTIPTPQPPRLV